ncbi:MAG: hypothetical protein ACLGI3_13495 [Actinomycetes bacterium]
MTGRAADLSDWPTGDVATLAGPLARINRIGEAREAEAGGRLPEE